MNERKNKAKDHSLQETDQIIPSLAPTNHPHPKLLQGAEGSRRRALTAAGGQQDQCLPRRGMARPSVSAGLRPLGQRLSDRLPSRSDVSSKVKAFPLRELCRAGGNGSCSDLVSARTCPSPARRTVLGQTVLAKAESCGFLPPNTMLGEVFIFTF